MGVTIHYKLAQEPTKTKAMLDATEKIAKGIKVEIADKIGLPFEIIRQAPKQLFINIGGCETLAFDFAPLKHWREVAKKQGWTYQNAVLLEKSHNEQDRSVEGLDYGYDWAAGFCKTQFAEYINEHIYVADLIKSVASKCEITIVGDEGDYYHTGKIEDARIAINENGKLIDSVGNMLKIAGGKDMKVIKGGETKIKPTKK